MFFCNLTFHTMYIIKAPIIENFRKLQMLRILKMKKKISCHFVSMRITWFNFATFLRKYIVTLISMTFITLWCLTHPIFINIFAFFNSFHIFTKNIWTVNCLQSLPKTSCDYNILSLKFVLLNMRKICIFIWT